MRGNGALPRRESCREPMPSKAMRTGQGRRTAFSGQQISACVIGQLAVEEIKEKKVPEETIGICKKRVLL